MDTSAVNRIKKEMRKERKRRKRPKLHKRLWLWFEDHMTPVIVTFSILTVLVFSVVTMVCAALGMNVWSDTLIEYVFKFFGFEMLALSGIKISKHIGSAFGRAEGKIDGTEPMEDEE